MLFSRFLKSSSGAFSVKFAIALLPLIYCAGVAIDTSRLVQTRSSLQDAADSAALQAALNVSANAGQMKKESEAVVETNMMSHPHVKLKGFNAKRNNDGTVDVSVNGKLDAAFMQIAGFPKLEVAVTSTAINGSDGGRTEIAMVIDHTGSLMWSNNFNNLVGAMEDFVSEIAGGYSDLGDTYVSFVPWSSTINVGSSRTSWLKTSSLPSYTPDTWHGCVEMRTGGLDVTDAPPVGSNRFDPYYWVPDTNNNWTGVSDTSLFSDFRTQTQFDAGSLLGLGPNLGCDDPIVSLTNSRTEIDQAIDRFKQHASFNGGTMMPIGMIWGIRTLSPAWSGLWGGSTPSDMPAANSKKAIVFLTDGGHKWNGFQSGETHEYSAYGYPADNFLGVSNPNSQSSIVGGLSQKLRESCDLAKSMNIEIYVIAYAGALSDVGDLKYCASSIDEHYLEAPNRSQISSAFKDVAENISGGSKEVRLVR